MNGAGVEVEKVGVSDEEIVDVVSVVVAGVSVDVKLLFKEEQLTVQYFSSISSASLSRFSHSLHFYFAIEIRHSDLYVFCPLDQLFFISSSLSFAFFSSSLFFFLFLFYMCIKSIISKLLFYFSFHFLFFFIFFSPVASLFVESKVVVAFTSSFVVKLDSIVVEVKVDSIVFVVKLDSRGLVVKFASIVFVVEVKSDSFVLVDDVVIVVVKTGKVSFSVLFLAQ